MTYKKVKYDDCCLDNPKYEDYSDEIGVLESIHDKDLIEINGMLTIVSWSYKN